MSISWVWKSLLLFIGVLILVALSWITIVGSKEPSRHKVMNSLILSQVSRALIHYHRDHHKFPEQSEGLGVLNQPSKASDGNAQPIPYYRGSLVDSRGAALDYSNDGKIVRVTAEMKKLRGKTLIFTECLISTLQCSEPRTIEGYK